MYLCPVNEVLFLSSSSLLDMSMKSMITWLRLKGFHPYIFTAVEAKTDCDVKVSEKRVLQTIAPLVRSVEETPEPITTEVQGNIPTWINGNFLRNGPGKFEFGNTQ